STTWSPKRFSTLSKRMAGTSPSSSVIAPVWVSSGGVFKTFLQSPGQQRAQIAGDEVDEAGEDDRLDVAEVLAAVELRLADELGHGDHHQERGVLEHRDHVVAQGGQGGAQRLRDD